MGIETNSSNVLDFQDSSCVQPSSLYDRGKRSLKLKFMYFYNEESQHSRVFPWGKGLYCTIRQGKTTSDR